MSEIKLSRKEIHTPIGTLTLIASDSAIHGVLFGNPKDLESQFGPTEEMKTHPLLKQCENELQEYFRGDREKFTVPVEPHGTEFQKKVWKSLLKIPYGSTVSYGEQATSMGKRSGVRAVAAANGRNPIAILIPCHRVISSTGHLHGFGGGLPTKKKLLEIEGVNCKGLQVTANA